MKNSIMSRKIKILKPLDMKIICEQNDCEMEVSCLNVLIVAPNIINAFKQLREELLFLWDEYAMESDENLTIDARQLKQRVLEYIKIGRGINGINEMATE